MSDQNLAVAKRGYEAFGRGDLDGLIAEMDPAVEWTTPGPAELASAGRRRGHAQVRDFFRIIGEQYEFQKFAPHTFIAQGDSVVVIGDDTVKVKATGTVISEEWVHVFTVKNGKIVAFREYLDTSAFVADLRMADAKA